MLYLWPQHGYGDEFEERDEICEEKSQINSTIYKILTRYCIKLYNNIL